ncbi:MAG: aspartate-semialdehyde dehydrogenase [Bacteroidales bacterium]|nr:aspartate-semialdehyde dehydrogenase [Bacteroidales bacterium]
MNRVAVVGVSGLVGRTMLRVLEERNFPLSELLPVASHKSEGKEILFKGEKHKIISIAEAAGKKPDIALFSAGSDVSLEWAPVYAKNNTIVIDNSSAWRMNEEVPLIIPEINASAISREHRIIANPNCSTIQLLMVLAPLHRVYGIRRLVISTYQAVTGTGMKAVRQLENEIKGIKGDLAYPYSIFMNCLPHCDSFLDNGYTREEMKLVNETRKILGDESIRITATAVRLPVTGGHSESVNVEFNKQYNLADIKEILNETEGVVVRDNPSENIYPMPLDVSGSDEVFVGRIRKDYSLDNALNLWIVADNIRKGAATNAVQIAETIIKDKR